MQVCQLLEFKWARFQLSEKHDHADWKPWQLSKEDRNPQDRVQHCLTPGCLVYFFFPLLKELKV